MTDASCLTHATFILRHSRTRARPTTPPRALRPPHRADPGGGPNGSRTIPSRQTRSVMCAWVVLRLACRSLYDSPLIDFFAPISTNRQQKNEQIGVTVVPGGGIDLHLPAAAGLGRDSVRLWVRRPERQVPLLLHADLTRPVKAFRRAVAQAYNMEREEAEAFWLDLGGKPLRDDVCMGDYAPTPHTHVCIHEDCLRGGMDG
jgi:hypothetical protein